MPTQISAQGLATGAITADKLASGAVTQDKFAAGIQTGGSGPTISTVTITDDTYAANGQTHMPTEGGYFKIVGTNFSAGIIVAIGNTLATATTFVSSTELHVQAPAKAEGTYQVQVTNSNGGWAFKANAITYSGTPTWSTGSSLTNGVSGTAYSLQLSAAGASSYSLAPGSSLPTGLTLSAGGLLSGTVTVGADTNYTFTIRAVDAENQYSSRTFNLNMLAVMPKLFNVSPAINGQSTWDLSVDGPLTIDSTAAYTLTAQYNFNADIKIWGAGGSSVAGGGGGYVGGTVNLTANETLTTYVGGGGSGSSGGSSGSTGAGGAGGSNGGGSAGSSAGPGSNGSGGGGGGGAGWSGWWKSSWFATFGQGGGAASILHRNGSQYAVSPGGGGGYRQLLDSGWTWTATGGAGGTGSGNGGNGTAGEGGAFVATPTGWTTSAGSGTTPGNSGNSARGTAGDPGTGGRIVITAVS